MCSKMSEFVCQQLGELEKLFTEKHEQYSSGADELANFRRGTLLNGRTDDAEGMFEELKAYMAKHIAFVYTHDILGDKITESLKDIAVYSLIGLYMAELAKAEDEEVYSIGPRYLDDALILATAESYHRGHELGNVIKPVFTARESKENTEK